MNAAQQALAELGFTQAWGADADHLKTPADVRAPAEVGFCFFTIDPSEYVSNEADRMPLKELEQAVVRLESDQIFAERGWRDYYLSQTFEVSSGLTLRFTTETLYRAAVK